MNKIVKLIPTPRRKNTIGATPRTSQEFIDIILPAQEIVNLIIRDQTPNPIEWLSFVFWNCSSRFDFISFCLTTFVTQKGQSILYPRTFRMFSTLFFEIKSSAGISHCFIPLFPLISSKRFSSTFTAFGQPYFLPFRIFNIPIWNSLPR